MKKILIAGATGYLGSYITNELIEQHYHVRAITRNVRKLKLAHPDIPEIVKAELTKPETLVNCCEGIDVVISSVGITRQKDKLSYMDVDYKVNLNLLNEAKKSGVKKFIYISIFNAEKMMDLKMIQAKQKFVEQLKASGLNYTIFKPTGFFSDMDEFLKMAKKGPVYLFGKRDFKINPIDGKDLAKACVEAVENNEKEINIGGPEVLTYQRIAETAFKVLNKPSRIIRIPIGIIKGILFLLRKLTRVQTYGPIEFLMTVLTMDMVAPQYGGNTLENHFHEIAK